MNPVTQFWDVRVLSVYALLSGYTKLNDKDISECIYSLTNSEPHFKYIVRVLVRLESAEKIIVTNIKNGNSVVKHEKLAQIVSPNPKWFNAKDHGKLTFDVTVTDKDWFRESVSEYLGLFKSNKLFAPVGIQPSSYAKQRKMLLAQLGDKDGMQYIDEDFNGLGTTFNMLETALTLADEQVVNIYDLALELGVNNSDIPLSHARIALDDENYVDNYNVAVSDIITEKTWLAELRVNGRRIEARIQGEQWHLIYQLRSDGGLYNFMHYMQNHPNINIGRADIQLQSGCEAYVDMTELPRRCGFDSKLKRYFFDGTTRLNARLNNPIQINADERTELKDILANR